MQETLEVLGGLVVLVSFLIGLVTGFLAIVVSSPEDAGEQKFLARIAVCCFGLCVFLIILAKLAPNLFLLVPAVTIPISLTVLFLYLLYLADWLPFRR